MKRLTEFVEARERIVARYAEGLAGLPLQLPEVAPDIRSAWHLYVIRLHQDDEGRHREIFTNLREGGIGVNLHYIPVYRQPDYRRLGYDPADYPEAERYYAQAITLPIHPQLTDAEQDQVIARVRELLGN